MRRPATEKPRSLDVGDGSLIGSTLKGISHFGGPLGGGPPGYAAAVAERSNMNLVKRFIQEDDGVTAIEYALIAALIAVAIITSLELLGGSISETFEEIEDAISNAGN